jgi:hypothetical protein
MGEAFIRELLSLCLQRIAVEENAMNNTELGKNAI